MKKFILLSIFFLSVNIHAQKTIDVIYLNDGSIIKGSIVESTSDRTRIETECGNIYAYKSSEIQKTERIPYVSKSTLKQKGYFNFTSMGALIGSSLNDKPAPISVLMEHNYRITDYFAPGLIIGVEALNETVVPVGLNMKWIAPMKMGSTLYAGFSGGYSFPLGKPETIDGYYEVKKAWGGYMFNAELGLILNSTSNSSFFVAMGYRYCELNYKRQDWYMTTVDRKMIYNRLSIRMGVTLF